MTNFKSKGLQNFESAHFDLNIFIKFAVVSVDHLADTYKSEEELIPFVAHLLNNAGERWGQARYDKPFEKLSMVRSRVTKSGIMWVFSAFEVYVNYANSYCSNVITSSKTASEDADDDIKIWALFSKYSWPAGQLNYLMPLLKFYTQARHCIVHNMGKANNTMVNILNSQEFANAVQHWPTVRPGRKLSSPPVILSDGTIIFNPHHAITYSDICFRIASIIDQNIFNSIGIEHFVVETAKNRLDKGNLLATASLKDIFSYLRACLSNDLMIKGLQIKNEEIKKILEDQSKWDEAKEDFKAIKIFLKKTEAENEVKKEKSKKAKSSKKS